MLSIVFLLFFVFFIFFFFKLLKHFILTCSFFFTFPHQSKLKQPFAKTCRVSWSFFTVDCFSSHFFDFDLVEISVDYWAGALWVPRYYLRPTTIISGRNLIKTLILITLTMPRKRFLSQISPNLLSLPCRLCFLPARSFLNPHHDRDAPWWESSVTGV